MLLTSSLVLTIDIKESRADMPVHVNVKPLDGKDLTTVVSFQLNKPNSKNGRTSGGKDLRADMSVQLNKPNIKNGGLK